MKDIYLVQQPTDLRNKMATKALPKYIRVRGHVYRLAAEPAVQPGFVDAWKQFDTQVLSFADMKRGIKNALATKDVGFFTDMATAATKLADVVTTIASFAEMYSGKAVTGKTKK